MKKRLGITIHWAGFLFGLMAVVGSDVGGILAAISVLGGWLFKYALTGRKGFFPWMTEQSSGLELGCRVHPLP